MVATVCTTKKLNKIEKNESHVILTAETMIIAVQSERGGITDDNRSPYKKTSVRGSDFDLSSVKVLQTILI